MAIPDRPENLPYYFHVYDYPGAKGFVPSLPMGLPIGHEYMQVCSLRADIDGLVAAARCKNLPARVEILGTTSGGKHIASLIFGRNQKKKIALTGGVHAREWIGVELPYLAAEYLIKNYNSMNNKYGKLITRLLKNCEVHVVPMVNPDGHTYSVKTDRNWRANRSKIYARRFTAGQGWSDDGAGRLKKSVARYTGHNGGHELAVTRDRVVVLKRQEFVGVDCNRNFPHIHWGKEVYQEEIDSMRRPALEDFRRARHTSADPKDSQNYCGPEPASELETKALVDMFRRYDFSASIDFHSPGRLIVYSDDASDDEATGKLGKCMQQLIHTTDNLAVRQGVWSRQIDKNKFYSLGASSEILYPAAGSLMDYAYSRHCAAYTIELGPAPKRGASFGLPRAQIQNVFEGNIRGVLCLLSCVAQFPKGMHNLRGAVALKQDMSKHVNEFKNWDVFGRGNKLPR